MESLFLSHSSVPYALEEKDDTLRSKKRPLQEVWTIGCDKFQASRRPNIFFRYIYVENDSGVKGKRLPSTCVEDCNITVRLVEAWCGRVSPADGC